MNVQSLSVVVPGGCPNSCLYCVSKTHKEIKYKDTISPCVRRIQNKASFTNYDMEQYINRMEFARDNGCNTVILTGEGEPVWNKKFLKAFGQWNKALDKPFRWIEIQTSGIGLDGETLSLLKKVGVNTISLSISSFNDEKNNEYNGIKPENQFNIAERCNQIKKEGFNLRLSINATDAFNRWLPVEIFNTASILGADQLTFRVLYDSGNPEHEVDIWINEHRVSNQLQKNFITYVQENGNKLEQLPFGPFKYSVDGVSTVIDDDCMSKELKDTIKYFILRPNGKLYTRWDDTGSLWF